MALNLGTIGRLNVVIGGDTSQLGKDLTDAEKRAKLFENRMAAAGAGIKVMAAGVATATAAIVLMVKGSLDAADKTHKLAQGAGMATQSFSELTYAAKLSGVEQEALAQSMARLNRNILDTAAGTGEAQRAFQALGISVKNNDGTLKSNEEIMAEVADKFADMEDGAGKAALAQMIFGRAGAQMIPMLNQGANGMAKLREEARLLGVTVDSEAGAAAEAFLDNMTRLGQVTQGWGNSIMKNLLPAIGAYSDDMVEAAKNNQGFSDSAKVVADFGKFLLSTFIAVPAVIKVAGDSVGKLAAAVMLFASGEWKQAMELMKTDGNDMATVVEEAFARINRVWEAQGGAAKGSEGEKKKKKSPMLGDPNEMKKNQDELKKLLEEDAKNWVDYVERVLKTLQEGDDKMLEEMRRNEENFKGLMESRFMSDADKEQKKFDEDMEVLRERLEMKLMTQEEFDNLAEQMEAQHQAKLTELEKKGWTERQKFAAMSMGQQVKTIFGDLASITAGVAQHNKKLFEINKVAGIANAIISTYEGVAKSLSAYPMPIAGIMAGIHLAAGLAQVSAIRSQTFSGGGGAAPSLAGSTAAPPVSPVGGGGGGGRNGGNTTVLYMQGGELYTDKQVRGLVNRLNESMADGGKIIIA